MDKKVTSTFHCVASGQVLKACGRETTEVLYPSLPKDKHPTIVSPVWPGLAARLVGNTPETKDGRTRPTTWTQYGIL